MVLLNVIKLKFHFRGVDANVAGLRASSLFNPGDKSTRQIRERDRSLILRHRGRFIRPVSFAGSIHMPQVKKQQNR